jgi:hypothetical protein
MSELLNKNAISILLLANADLESAVKLRVRGGPWLRLVTCGYLKRLDF